MKPGISVYNIRNEPVTGRRFRKVNQPVKLQPLSEKICLVEPM